MSKVVGSKSANNTHNKNTKLKRNKRKTMNKGDQ